MLTLDAASWAHQLRSCGDGALNWFVAPEGAMRQNKLRWKAPRLN